MYLAHSPNIRGEDHFLRDHLSAVARTAKRFAEKFGAGDLAYWVGLWHDLGKFHTDFQKYIADPQRCPRTDHSTAGAYLASQQWEPLAFPIAGHHGGLACLSGLKSRLREKSRSPAIAEALEEARQAIGSLLPQASLEGELPPFLQGTNSADMRRRLEMFLRMLFSALVDADFLDTEKHFHPETPALRADRPALQELWGRFESNQAELSGHKDDLLNRIRHEIYHACLEAGFLEPGIFSLTVPTGGGKTRSGMAFALRHALRHGLDRVIVAIPYLSITEQTAGEYRDIFGVEGVVEHHSAMREEVDSEDEQHIRARLASENWDAPIVVTTTVQLFESLFSNRPSACRKLHNIARSVLILDEVQTLPVHLLEPMLDVLHQLADDYRTSIVLCTATQPALEDSPYLRGLHGVREIVSAPQRHFEALKRVNYELPVCSERWSWQRVAQEMRRSDACLAVVNTKGDALHLLDALNDDAALHLSTSLCGAHRADVLAEVRRRLKVGQSCRLVSTQVVEAGVDLDFPLVLRALGPLDSVVQAAGRCNREGLLPAGRVIVFEPEEGRMPQGAYRAAADNAAILLKSHHAEDLHDPALYRTYFQRLYQAVNLDARDIQACREAFDYPEVANCFHLIDEETTPVVVRYSPTADRTPEVESLLEEIRASGGMSRRTFRRLQPYLVNLNTRRIDEYKRAGLVIEVVPGLWEWLGAYDPVRGITSGGQDPTDLVV